MSGRKLQDNYDYLGKRHFPDLQKCRKQYWNYFKKLCGFVCALSVNIHMISYNNYGMALDMECRQDLRYRSIYFWGKIQKTGIIFHIIL